MEQKIKPTTENSRILSEYLQSKVNYELKKRYPSAEDIVTDILK